MFDWALCLVPDHTLEISDQVKINKKVKKQIQSCELGKQMVCIKKLIFKGLCQPTATFFCSRCLTEAKPQRGRFC